MSECVVRMEMPQNCYNCYLRYECNAFYAPGKPKPLMKGCMIVCQLPEGHGRLIDASSKIMVPMDPGGEPQEMTIDSLLDYVTPFIESVVPAERSETEQV